MCDVDHVHIVRRLYIATRKGLDFMVYDEPVQHKKSLKKENDLSLDKTIKRLINRKTGIIFLVGYLCLVSAHTSEAQSIPLKALANKQLTDTQYKCHNAIVYKESRWKIDAVNGSHHGYYQGRSKALIGKPYDYQFYWYWYYVTNRYGVTEYDEPNYCNALHHLRTKGWQ